MADSRSEIEDRLRPHVQHVLDNLFEVGELDSWRFVWGVDDLVGRPNVAVVLTARGEVYYGFIWQEHPGHSPESGLDVFVSGLESFISESKFAWGQQRTLVQRPWVQ